jgi:hypothetical protein
MGTATNVNPKSAAFAPLAGPDHRVINRDQTEGVTINRYGTPDGRPIGRYQLRILAWVTGHAGCSAIEAVGRDRNPYGSGYTRPVRALAQRGLLLIDRSGPSRYRLYMTEAGFEALMVARHGTDWREQPSAAVAEEQIASIREEWQRHWEACQLARVPKQPKPTNIVEEAQRAQDGMRHAMLDGDQAEAQRLWDEREALIDSMGPLLRQQIAVNR